MAEVRLTSSIDPDAELKRLRARELNFDPSVLSREQPCRGWFIDNYRVSLPPELPGDPCAGGSWSAARELSKAYEFIDPKILRAFFDPGEPFEGRTMLLEIHFWGLRIYAGVRVGGAYEGYRAEGGRRARVWAWNYRTLAGHFEQGQIDYEVKKWLDTGEVEFRIDAVSRRADADHALVNLGFVLFGRRRQKEFAQNACERMAKLTRTVLDGGLDLTSLRATGTLTVRPSLFESAGPQRAERSLY